MTVFQTKVKERLSGILDELSPEQRQNVLDFALFLKTQQVGRDSQDSVAVKAKPERDSSYPLRGTVLRYVDPFTPIAQEDWEALQ